MHKTTAWDDAVDEGLHKGTLLTAQKYLLKIGRQRFGTPDSKTRAALTSIDDPSRLERMADVILSLKTWNELLAVK